MCFLSFSPSTSKPPVRRLPYSSRQCQRRHIAAAAKTLSRLAHISNYSHFVADGRKGEGAEAVAAAAAMQRISSRLMSVDNPLLISIGTEFYLASSFVVVGGPGRRLQSVAPLPLMFFDTRINRRPASVHLVHVYKHVVHVMQIIMPWTHPCDGEVHQACKPGAGPW